MFVCRADSIAAAAVASAASAGSAAVARHARVHRSIISLWHASLRSALGTVLQRRLAHAPGELRPRRLQLQFQLRLRLWLRLWLWLWL